MRKIYFSLLLSLPTLLFAQDCLNLPDTLFTCGFSEQLPLLQIEGNYEFLCDMSEGIASLDTSLDTVEVKVANCGFYYFSFTSNDPECPVTDTMMIYFDDPSSLSTSGYLDGGLTYNDYGCHGGGSNCSNGNGGPVQVTISGQTPPSVAWNFNVTGGCNAVNYQTEILNLDAGNCTAEDILILTITSNESDSIGLSASEDYVLAEYPQIYDSLYSEFLSELANNDCQLLNTGCTSLCMDNPDMNGDSISYDTIYTILPNHQGGNWTLLMNGDTILLNDTTVFNYNNTNTELQLIVEPGADYYGPNNIDWSLSEIIISQDGDTIPIGISANYDLTLQWQEFFTYDTVDFQIIENIIPDEICLGCGGTNFSYSSADFSEAPSYDCGPIVLSFYYDECICNPPYVDAQVFDAINCTTPCTDVFINSSGGGNFITVSGPNGQSESGIDLTGFVACEPGVYFVDLISPFGCQEFSSFQVQGDFEEFEESFSVEVCAGSCYNWNGVDYCDAGEYQQTFAAETNGCDSLVTLNLSISEMLEEYENRTICEGECTFWYDQNYCAAGTYSLEVVENGCNITRYLELAEEAAPQGILSVSNVITCLENEATIIANGNFSTIVWSNGSTQDVFIATSAGSYTAEIISENGCSSFVSIEVEEETESTEDFESVLVCQGETYEGFPAGEYQIDSEDPNTGCINTLNLTVVEENIVFGLIPSSTTLDCNNPTISLEIISNTNNNIVWSDGQIGNFIEVNQAGTYIATMTSENGCNYSADIEITQSSDENNVVEQNFYFCPGECVDVNGNPICEAGVFTYTETNDEGCTTEYINNVFASQGSIGSTLDLPVLDCENSTGTAYLFIQNEFSDFSEFEIFLPNGDSYITTDAPLAFNVSEGGDYSIVGYYFNASQGVCQAEYSFTIEDNSEEILLEEIENQTIDCQSGTASLLPTLYPDYQYIWQGPGINADNVNANELSLNIAGTYNLSVTNPDSGCSANATYVILPEQEVSFEFSTLPTCENAANGEISVNQVSGGTEPYYYALDADSVQLANNFTELEAGNYTLYVSDSNNCQTALEVQIPQINSIPEFEETVFEICGDESIVIDASIAGGSYEYLWLNGSTEPTVNAMVEGTYEVEISNQCESKMFDFTVKNNGKDPKKYIFIPNAFSPNSGDVNVELRGYFGKEVLEYHFRIFDRWGNIVFFTNDPEIAWDGTARGKALGTGVYLYSLSVTMNGCNDIPQTVDLMGDILLLK